MKIRLIKIEGTGIDPNDFAVGDVVEATRDSDTTSVFIKIPNDASKGRAQFQYTHYVLVPEWFELV